MQSVEYGPSGPTQVKDITPPDGMTPEMASFIAANASPFTNPRDMPAPAKVPDPRNTMDTDTAFIWGRTEVAPHYNTSTLQYELVVMSSPDPLAPVPLWISKTSVGASATTAYTSPNTINTDYQNYNLKDMVSQMDSLARRSRAYRVVGHGLKAWVSRSATLGTGNLTAGQFDYASAKSPLLSTWIPGTYQSTYSWSNPPEVSAGVHGFLLQSNNAAHARTVIAQSKNDELGFLAADEGATVRWTDRSDFAFKPTQNLNCVHPMRAYCPTSPDDRLQCVNLDSNGAVPSSDWQRVLACPPWTAAQTHGSSMVFNATNNACCSYFSSANTAVPQISMAWNGNDTGPVVGNQMFFHSPGVDLTVTDCGQYQMKSSVFSNYVLNPKNQFDTGLYIDVTGLSAGQTVVIQSVWHVEFVPIGTEPWSSALPSPVDMSYETFAALLRNRKAFPIVVKGHSFFSSLRNAVAKVGRFAGKVLGITATAGTALAATGAGPLAAFGGALAAGSAAGMAGIAAVSAIDSAVDDVISAGRAAKRIAY